MKVSLNQLKKYLAFEIPPAKELAEKIGAQLGAIEAVIDLGEKYRGIVIVKVVECRQIENTDHLSICKIDDGGAVKDVERDDKGLVQVVCGAPNVREGLSAAWLPPGATVPSSYGEDPFVLESRDIRGQKSNGMLASPKELALSDNHEGILEIGGEHKPGDDFAEAFGLSGDSVLDIENKMFTHRPDCFGLVGIAREVAGIMQQPFKSPDWYVINPQFPASAGEKLEVSFSNELPELVPRFTAVAISGVQVGTSPVWLQVELAKLGQKSINNIVDYTNWFMLDTGQPLHAYDYDKLKALSGGTAALVVRQPHKDETLKLLNGKEIEPRPEAIVIATDKQLIGVGGVMGGTDTEVDAGTKNIILECANFDMYSVRRTAMAHGLFTDAVTRFTKGQSPLQNLAVLTHITAEICQHAGGQVADQVIDDNHLDQAAMERGSLYPPVKVTTDFINSRLGLKLSAADMKTVLENVEFRIEINDDVLTVTAPFWRTDIELPEDVVEEVGRLHGYDKLPLEIPRRDLTPAVQDSLLAAKAQIRERLSRAGANEVLTYSFVHGGLLDKIGQDQAKAFQLGNALSPDLQYYRLSLMPSLLGQVHANIKTGYDEFALFELGKTHSLDHVDDGGLPGEFEFTALVLAANDKLKKAGAAYYQARQYLENLVGEGALAFKPVSKEMEQYPVVQPYNLNRAALVDIPGIGFLGIIGEFKPSVARALKLPKYCAGFEVDTTVLQAVLTTDRSYSPLPRFPKVVQDISLKLSIKHSHQDIVDCFWHEYKAQELGKVDAHLSTLDIYQSENDAEFKHVTLRFTIASYERTLTDPEVNKILDTIADALKTKFGAERL